MPELGGHAVRYWPATDDDIEFFEFDVPSAKDPEVIYTVLLDSISAQCSCSGYQYRKTCRHVTLVHRLIQGG